MLFGNVSKHHQTLFITKPELTLGMDSFVYTTDLHSYTNGGGNFNRAFSKFTMLAWIQIPGEL